MTREEAKEIIMDYRQCAKGIFHEEEADIVAFDMAIEAFKAQDVVEKLTQDLADKLNDAYAKGYNAANREIALSGEYERAYQRGKADATKWIPCSKRLPEMYDKKLLGDYDNSKEVMVTIQYHGYSYVAERCIVYCSDGAWRYSDDNDVVHEIEDAKVVAWMPPPEPYKEGE